MWKLSIEDDQGQSTIVQLVRGEYSIGRTEENTIRLTERNISRHHARLLKHGAAWFLDDLGSYNGCFVNGARVVEHQPIQPNDLIQLGDYRLELHADEAETLAAAQTSPQRVDNLATTLNLSAQADRLVMVVGPTPGREFLLAQAPQRIGRGEECDICVNHSSVSRWHADINFVGSGRYEVVDHNSSNGIRLNGVELGRGLLDARDLLELGDIVLKFIPAGQVYRPTPDESRQLAALLGVDVEGPPPSAVERAGFIWRSMSKATRWGTVLLGIVVAVLFSFVVANRQMAARSSLSGAPVVTSENERHRETLAAATRQLERGELEQAHRLLQTIPLSSPAAADPAFQSIETNWGKRQMARAESATTNDERKALWETVANARSVDATTRTQAADLLARLQSQAPDATPLSSVEAVVASAAPPTSAPEEERIQPAADMIDADAHPAPGLTGVPQSTKRVAGAKTTTTATSGQETATKATVPAAGQGQKVAASPTPSPTEPSLTDLATSGNLDSVRAARDALKRKVAAGTATEREKRLLRASCRQLNDASCSR